MTTLADLKRANTAPATSQQSAEIALVKPGYESNAAFTALQRIGKMFAMSNLVPAQFQGEANIGNTSIALEMALRMKASPMMVLQNMYMVYGKPGWSTQFLIACFNQTGRFSSLHYEFEGQPNTDGWGCRATATELSTGEKVTGTLVTIAIAKKEGWYGKSGSKWQTMPEQMLRYRAAAWFIRSVAPEVAMGMYTVDELRDIEKQERQYVPVQQTVQPMPEPEPEPEQPKKRGRKPKAESAAPEPEQVEEAEEVQQTEFAQVPNAVKTKERLAVEDACANFEDYPIDPDACVNYVMSSMQLNRNQATEWAAANIEKATVGIRDFLKRNLPTWEQLKANRNEATSKVSDVANYFGVSLEDILAEPLYQIKDAEQRQRQQDSIMTNPDSFLFFVGKYIRS